MRAAGHAAHGGGFTREEGEGVGQRAGRKGGFDGHECHGGSPWFGGVIVGRAAVAGLPSGRQRLALARQMPLRPEPDAPAAGRRHGAIIAPGNGGVACLSRRTGRIAILGRRGAGRAVGHRSVNVRRIGVAVLALVAGIGAAWAQAAQENFPDVTGVWEGESIAVSRPAGSGEVRYTEDRITQVVREQHGRRFAGEMRATSGGKPSEVRFVGIFIDESRFVWSEPNGFVEGRLVGPHTIESCYVRTSRQNAEVACNRLVRRKK
ncbi:MAG: hypothetical protein AcusKO_37100 [Acuticoccus sp.]